MLKDRFGRVHDYLRISVTDRCNLNCVYCNPSDQTFNFLKDSEILTEEEYLRLIRIFVEHLGFKKIRFTGGEPLAKKNVIDLISRLKPLNEEYGVETGVTTNGTILKSYLSLLKKYSVSRLNISLDTLDSVKFFKITGKDKFNDVFEAILAAEKMGFDPLKINCVMMRGINDNEILDFADFIKDRNLNIRFIEYMPFSGNKWSNGKFISYLEMKNILESKFVLIPILKNRSEVANNFQLSGYKGTVSFISSISNHFCDGCSRLRITSEGNLKLCLFSPKNTELDLKSYLRSQNYDDKDIAEIIERKLQDKELQHADTPDLLKLEKNNMLSIGG